MWTIFKVCWICYNIASVLHFGFWPQSMWDLSSPNGIEPLHWKAKSQPLDSQGSPSESLLNNRRLFLTVLVVGSPRSGFQHCWVMVADFLLYRHMVEGRRESSGFSLIRALIPAIRDLPLWPNHLPRACLLIHWPALSRWALGIQLMDLGGTQIFGAKQ